MNLSIRRNKYKKYQSLRKSGVLRDHIPNTRQMTEKNLANYLTRFGDIILKPLGGSRGSGVIRVTAANQNQYEIHHEKKKKTVESKERLYEEINGIIGNSRYIVQRRIQLATVGGRPFDMRVIVQKIKKTGGWKVTGKAAKVAGEGYIVTNITRSGGTVLPVKTAIRKSELKDLSRSELTANIDKVALLAAARLKKMYTRQRIFGFDMGLDQAGRVWIIEANLSPMLTHFKKLKNRTVYRRIIKYKRRSRISRIKNVKAR